MIKDACFLTVRLCLSDIKGLFFFVCFVLFCFVLFCCCFLSMMEEVNFDPRLCVPFSCMIVGPSGCGKTFFVKRLLENCEHVMDSVPDNIVWIYTSFQPMYDEQQNE